MCGTNDSAIRNVATARRVAGFPPRRDGLPRHGDLETVGVAAARRAAGLPAKQQARRRPASARPLHWALEEVGSSVAAARRAAGLPGKFYNGLLQQ